jgi:protein transport protein SEC61 subunit gamma-like protein
MDQADVLVKPVKEFGKNSVRLVKRCTKPDRKGERKNQSRWL